MSSQNRNTFKYRAGPLNYEVHSCGKEMAQCGYCMEVCETTVSYAITDVYTNCFIYVCIPVLILILEECVCILLRINEHVFFIS